MLTLLLVIIVGLFIYLIYLVCKSAARSIKNANELMDRKGSTDELRRSTATFCKTASTLTIWAAVIGVIAGLINTGNTRNFDSFVGAVLFLIIGVPIIQSLIRWVGVLAIEFSYHMDNVKEMNAKMDALLKCGSRQVECLKRIGGEACEDVEDSSDVTCPHCGGEIKADGVPSGTRVSCPYCGYKWQIS